MVATLAEETLFFKESQPESFGIQSFQILQQCRYLKPTINKHPVHRKYPLKTKGSK